MEATSADLMATLAVEVGVHHLDLDVLDALVGRSVPQGWDDAHYIPIGTGRTALTAADRKSLGPVADLFPIFG